MRNDLRISLRMLLKQNAVHPGEHSGGGRDAKCQCEQVNPLEALRYE